MNTENLILPEKRADAVSASERGVFRNAVALFGVLSAAALLYNLCIGKGTASVLTALAALVFSAICFFLDYFTGKFASCYAVFAFGVSCILAPAAFFLCGGFASGVCFFCFASVGLCALCRRRKTAVFIGILSLLLNAAAQIAVYVQPSLAVSIPAELEVIDRIVFGTMVCVAVLIGVTALFSGYQQSVSAGKLLSVHIDSRVVSLMSNAEDYEKNAGKKRKISVMFVDISNFTGISESMAPETVSDFLSVFFQTADACVHANDGILDKYIGDCAMAYWIDSGNGDSVRKACRTADEIRQSLKKQSEEIYSRFKCDLECGIGINYGEAIVGEVGSERRKDFTVIGDTVNLASRLESIAPAGIVYLSAEAASVVKDCVNIAKVPKKVVLKGKNNPVDIYTLVDLSAPERVQNITPWVQPTGYVMHVCGSRGSYSLAGKRYYEYGGETSCYILKKDNYALILDCGTGLQRAREIIADCTKIDVILTHVHYDHIIGLLDWSIFPPMSELTFYGNFDNWLGENTIHELLKAPYWPVDISRGAIISVKTLTDYTMNGDINAVFYPASHPNNANLVVLDICGKRICLMADCENPKDLPLDVVHGCDMLMYDGMYEDRYYHEHVGWGHSTWESGVRLAMEAKVHRLVITHHSPRNSDEKLHGLEMEAQEMFPATTFAKAGDRFII